MTAQQLYAQIYDLYVANWPNEVDFYRELIRSSPLSEQGILEIACGTGRMTLQLAQENINLTGLDLSPELLAIANEKSTDVPNVSWVQGDMRTFDLAHQFGIAIMPGHSFQFMTTPEDQMKCLTQIKTHLVTDGLLVLHLDHQDIPWLGGLIEQHEPAFKTGQPLTHPKTGRTFRQSYAWTFDIATHTATIQINWEELDQAGNIVETWRMAPLALHCIFRFEMEHALKRAGFSIEAVYGDFSKNELASDSGQMIWVARNN